MKKEEKPDFDDITRRLDAIIRILLRQNQVQEMSSGEQIVLLKTAGLTDIEIARFLGRTRSYVSSAATLTKRKKVKKNVRK